MAGVGTVRVWAVLAAALAPALLGGGPAKALDRPEGPRCRIERDYPWQIERLLHLLADGMEGRRECARHRHHGHRLPAGPCPADRHRIACVDQDRQLMWVQQGRKVVFGPVPARTGAPWNPTRNGLHRVYRRSRDQVSTLYGDPMPYSQFFDRGEAFHGVRSDLRATAGSYGCVNLGMADARRLWDVLRLGDRVYVWGRKPPR